MSLTEVLAELRSLSSPTVKAAQARFGIDTSSSIGVSAPKLKALAKRVGRDHSMALKLWGTGIHEARMLASLIDEPAKVTRTQMDRWVKDFDSWDLVDCTCGYLFDRTPFAVDKVFAWADREEEFVKRAAFSLIAYLAVHDKKADDALFESFLPLIDSHADDDRNFVKKSVNWALRQIGKRNLRLNQEAIATAIGIKESGSKAGRWIASDALRELTSTKVQERLRK